jgi:hypothetical protein
MDDKTMDDKTVSTAATTNSSDIEQIDGAKNVQTVAHVSSPVAEHKQAYGTAKTDRMLPCPCGYSTHYFSSLTCNIARSPVSKPPCR